MKKLFILSVLCVFSSVLFSCTGDELPAGSGVSAGDHTDPPVGGQGGTIPTPPVTPKP